MDRSLFLTLLFFSAIPATAQSVDFEVPAEISIVPGRLSVVFNDGVNEQSATALVTTLGYEILQSTFTNLSAVATSNETLSASEVENLERSSGVVEVQQLTRPAGIQSTRPSREDASRRNRIEVIFESHLSQMEALGILKQHTSLSFTFLPRQPNELVIEVGDQDEAALSALEGRDEVKWVTYVGTAGND